MYSSDSSTHNETFFRLDHIIIKLYEVTLKTERVESQADIFSPQCKLSQAYITKQQINTLEITLLKI